MLKIAIAGLGTVGAGTVRLLQANADLIAARCGQLVTVSAACARGKDKKRDCDLTGMAWVEDALQLPLRADVDAVVELIGGADGVALLLAEAVLRAGKSLITANKALLAKHGVALARLAEANKAQIYYEAAVAGGIPIIKTMREGLGGNRITSVRGILNGTCNYILTRMREGCLSFEAALEEAQHLGFAEADASGDIDGHDTANKLALLAALAFGSEPDLRSIQIEGIRRITPLDLQFAEELGCRIKLLGVAKYSDGGIAQHVSPSLVPKQSLLARVDGALNAVSIQGDFVGDIMIEGQGAGAHPTASAVVADIIDCARGIKVPVFGVAAGQLKKCPIHKTESEARYYMRLQVVDKPGVVADISSVLRDAEISIEAMLQRSRSATESVLVVLTTHSAKADIMRQAVETIAKLPSVFEKPCLLRIED